MNVILFIQIWAKIYSSRTVNHRLRQMCYILLCNFSGSYLGPRKSVELKVPFLHQKTRLPGDDPNIQNLYLNKNVDKLIWAKNKWQLSLPFCIYSIKSTSVRRESPDGWPERVCGALRGTSWVPGNPASAWGTLVFKQAWKLSGVSILTTHILYRIRYVGSLKSPPEQQIMGRNRSGAATTRSSSAGY